ncbi:N-6 DNA methylase [Helicobacter bilis]|uniref:Eco57I restriction-modification methylase domain-containing protein n=2 Tax=Helicobacter bilis TaxID=37372 RepID=UPI00248E8F8A|nr:N-6 DNA methylase [Helicobacter bilis]
MTQAHKETLNAIYPLLIDKSNIEEHIMHYALDTIKPNKFEEQSQAYSSNIDKNIINTFKEHNLPLCLETFNVLFEKLLEQSYKNENGIVFTPKYIADFICKDMLRSEVNLDSIKIIDPACGCGIFLISVIELIKEKTHRSIKDIVKNQIFGLDISSINTERVKILLKIMCLMYGETIKDNDINIQCVDSLKENWNMLFNICFDYIVGNPPYVNPHTLNKKQVDFLKNNFKTTSKGVFNIFYAFIEQSIKFLDKNGKISFIVPNNFLTISAAKPLRDFIEPYLTKLIDLQDNMVFKPIRTYNAIITLDKTNTKSLEYANLSKTNNIKEALQNIHFQMLDKQNIFLEKWRFLDTKTESNIAKIESQFFNFATFINAGIATLRDEVYRVEYDGKQYYRDVNGKRYIIDTELIKPIYKIPEFKNTGQCGYFIFPYTIIKNNAIIIDEVRMQKDFTQTYNYLLARKDELDSRDKGKINAVAWYAYGRTQGLNRYGKKLLFGTFSSKPNFILIQDKKALFCNGYAVFENPIMEIEILEKIFNSCIMDYYIKHTSYQIEGGYFCYQKKYIEKFSVPFLDSSEKEFLLKSNNKQIDGFLIDKYGLDL